MNSVRIRLLNLRSSLEYIIQSQEGKKGQYAAGVRAVGKVLAKDFDRMFSPELLKDDKKIHPLIEKYCHKEGCPICGAKTERKVGKYGAFIGCSRYPDCRGVRKSNGSVSINDELRMFLTQKVYEEKVKENSAESRFENLDI